MLMSAVCLNDIVFADIVPVLESLLEDIEIHQINWEELSEIDKKLFKHYGRLNGDDELASPKFVLNTTGNGVAYFSDKDKVIVQLAKFSSSCENWKNKYHGFLLAFVYSLSPDSIDKGQLSNVIPSKNIYSLHTNMTYANKYSGVVLKNTNNIGVYCKDDLIVDFSSIKNHRVYFQYLVALQKGLECHKNQDDENQEINYLSKLFSEFIFMTKKNMMDIISKTRLI